MPLSTEKIPNNPLTGVELQQRVLYVLRQVFEERLPPPIDKAFLPIPLALLAVECQNDFVFGATVVYPNCGWKATAKFHFTAPDAPVLEAYYSLEVEFSFRNITMPKHTVRTRSTPPPMPNEIASRAETGVVAFTIEEHIDNPNLVRVNSGLPITITRAIRPEPGEFIGRIERHDIQYDKTDYPAPPDPVVVDISTECRAEWGVPEPKVSEAGEAIFKLPANIDREKFNLPPKERRQPEKKPAGRYSLKDKADLDAIGQEE